MSGAQIPQPGRRAQPSLCHFRSGCVESRIFNLFLNVFVLRTQFVCYPFCTKLNVGAKYYPRVMVLRVSCPRIHCFPSSCYPSVPIFRYHLLCKTKRRCLILSPRNAFLRVPFSRIYCVFSFTPSVPRFFGYPFCTKLYFGA